VVTVRLFARLGFNYEKLASGDSFSTSFGRGAACLAAYTQRHHLNAFKRGFKMNNGFGNSSVATQYIYQRVWDILDGSKKDMAADLSRLLDELAHNYKVDTGRLIGEDL